MESLKNLISTFLHLDASLQTLVTNYPTAVYLVLFAIVFVETGLVIMPFLPGDSLLFAAGTIAAGSGLSLPLLYVVFILGAFCGDNTNYFLGKFIGPRLFKKEDSKLLNRKHLERTNAFFEKYGGKTVIMARFVPIVRTFTPFVAGLGSMKYRQFLAYSVGGAVLWVGVCVTSGYLFGNIPLVKKNFSITILAVIAISLIPVVIEVLKHRKAARSS